MSTTSDYVVQALKDARKGDVSGYDCGDEDVYGRSAIWHCQVIADVVVELSLAIERLEQRVIDLEARIGGAT